MNFIPVLVERMGVWRYLEHLMLEWTQGALMRKIVVVLAGFPAPAPDTKPRVGTSKVHMVG